MVRLHCVFVGILLDVFSAQAFKVLLVFPVPARSMSLLGEAYVRHLLNDGHEVTLITAYPMKNKPQKNYKEIDVSSIIDYEMDNDLYTISYLIDHKAESVDNTKFQQVGYKFARLTLEHEGVQKLLKDPSQNFEVVIAELFESELHSGFAAYYDCPMIWSYSLGVDWSVLKLVHEASNPAYSVDYVSENLVPLNLYQRLQELWVQAHGTFYESVFIAPNEASAYESNFRPLFVKKGKTLPPFESLKYNASLVFGNLHHGVRNIPALPQSYKLIGGFHIDTPVKALPEDLQRIMDNASRGVIYFSMGSILKSETMPNWLEENLLKMFGELKQTILWKYEADLKNMPKNLHAIKWAPQHSILAHPNCMLFITHGGLLSSTEAIHFGVPTVGVPLFMDQYLNVEKAAAAGYAIKVDLSRQLDKDLQVAINKILQNPSYRAKVKELSAVYHSRPVPPSKEMVHWVRHVVESRGAPHLRSPALMVPWYQKAYIDFAALVLIVILALWKMINVGLYGSGKKTAESKKTN